MSHSKKPPRSVAPWKYGVGLWISACIVGAFLYAGEAMNFARGTPRIIFFHLPMAMLSVIAFWTSMGYAIQLLRRRTPVSDLKSMAAAELGLLFGVLATLTGSIFAAGNWNSFWNWDPRETSMLVLLLIYGAYFALRSSVDDEERRARLAAVYNIYAGIIMPILVFVVPRIPALESSHPANVWTRGKMSADYRIVLYSMLLGFIGLFIWMFQLRLRAGLLEEQAEDSPHLPGAMVK